MERLHTLLVVLLILAVVLGSTCCAINTMLTRAGVGQNAAATFTPLHTNSTQSLQAQKPFPTNATR